MTSRGGPGWEAAPRAIAAQGGKLAAGPAVHGAVLVAASCSPDALAIPSWPGGREARAGLQQARARQAPEALVEVNDHAPAVAMFAYRAGDRQRVVSGAVRFRRTGIAARRRPRGRRRR